MYWHDKREPDFLLRAVLQYPSLSTPLISTFETMSSQKDNKAGSFQTAQYKKQSWIALSSVALLTFVVALWPYQPLMSFHRFQTSSYSVSKSRTYNDITAPRENVWADLSDEDIKGLREFLYKGPNDLNLSVGIDTPGY